MFRSFLQELRILLPLLMTAFLLTPASHAETTDSPSAPFAQKPVIDGLLQDEAWQSPAFPMLFDRLQGIPGRAPTRVWLAHDEENLFAAVEARGERIMPSKQPPNDVVETLGWPGVRLHLAFTPTGEKERVDFEFVLTAAGVKAAARNGDWTFAGQWESATRLVADGYLAEVKIPFASMGLEKAPKSIRFAIERNVGLPHEEVQGWPVRSESVQTCELILPKETVAADDVASTDTTVLRGQVNDLLADRTWTLAILEDDPLRQRVFHDMVGRARSLLAVESLPMFMSGAANAAVDLAKAQMDSAVAGSAHPLPRVFEMTLPSTQGRARLALVGDPRPEEKLPAIVVLGPRGISPERLALSLDAFRGFETKPFYLLLPSDITLRGDSLYHGEEAILDLLEEAASTLPIDPHAIHLVGVKEGGSAALRTAVRIPDRFASVVSIDGEGDAGLAGNLFSTNAMLHVETQDKELPEGHWSQAWKTAFESLPGIGEVIAYKPAKSDPLLPAVDADLVRKVLSNRLTEPSAIAFRPPSMKFNKAWWLTVDRLDEWPPSGSIDLKVTAENTIKGTAEGIGGVSIDMTGSLFTPDRDAVLKINGVSLYSGPYRPSIQVELASAEVSEAAVKKDADHPGTLDEAFNGDAIYIWGTRDGGEWEAASKEAAVRAARRCDGLVSQLAVSDKQWIASQQLDANLFLFGGPARNDAVAMLAGSLPVTFGENGLRVGKTLISDDSMISQFIHPNPLHPDKYIVIHWARSPEAMQLADWNPDPARFHLLPDGMIDRIERTGNGHARRLAVAQWWFDENWLPRELLQIK